MLQFHPATNDCSLRFEGFAKRFHARWPAARDAYIGGEGHLDITATYLLASQDHRTPHEPHTNDKNNDCCHRQGGQNRYGGEICHSGAQVVPCRSCNRLMAMSLQQRYGTGTYRDSDESMGRVRSTGPEGRSKHRRSSEQAEIKGVLAGQ